MGYESDLAAAPPHPINPTADASRSVARASVSHDESINMSNTGTIDQVTPATEAGATTEAPKQAPARTARRWPWIAALVVVAGLGAAGTGIAAASAADAQAQLAALQEEHGDLETRAGIAQSSLDLMRENRDRLELQLEELQAQMDELQASN